MQARGDSRRDAALGVIASASPSSQALDDNYRNLGAMEAEDSLRRHSDRRRRALVFCDNTVPSLVHGRDQYEPAR